MVDAWRRKGLVIRLQLYDRVLDRYDRLVRFLPLWFGADEGILLSEEEELWQFRMPNHRIWR